MANTKNSLSAYEKSGVNINASSAFVQELKELSATTRHFSPLTKLGDFAGLLDINLLSYKNPVLAFSCDGVGTKASLASMAQLYEYIGIDLVAMCVNDLLAKGAEPLVFLDYFATQSLNKDRDIAIAKSIAQGCNIAGCNFIGGETAQMFTLPKDSYELAGFAAGIVERDKILPQELAVGDHIIGLSSSGVHANGFSLIHKILKEEKIDIFAKASFDTQHSYAERFLAPTKIYVKPILAALKKFIGIKAIAHITGGGILQNLPRVLPPSLSAELDLAFLPRNDLFVWLAKKLKFNSINMLQIFNCGIGMILIVDPSLSATLCHELGDAVLIGCVKQRANDIIELKGSLKDIT